MVVFLIFAILTDPCSYVSSLCVRLLGLQLQPTHAMQYYVSPAVQSKFREKLIKDQVWRENR